MKDFRCRSCDSPNVELVLDLGDQPWGNNFIDVKSDTVAECYPLKFCLCTSCMLAQIDFTIPKEKMFVNHSYMSGTTRALKSHFNDIGKKIIERVNLKSEDYILDIGGNDGTFLEFFKDKGICVLNVDSGVRQAQICNAKNIPCLNNFFNKDQAIKIIEDKGVAKIIHGSGIFFHLEELQSVFAGVKLLLSPDGILVAEFIYLPEMLLNCAYDQIYHEHLLYYSLFSFQNILNQFELEIFDVELKPIHGGSCIAYITHKGRESKSPRLLRLEKKELVNGIDKIETYFEFAERAEVNRKILRDTVRSIKQKGLSIMALGAPVKGSTIINYCKLTTKEIDCGVEINPHKFNTYFPGTKIPVYDQNQTLIPDVYLLLAWNFKDEILSKLVDFRKNGGKVLLPIPKPEII